MKKICCRCKIEKDLNFFGKDKSSTDGLTYACKKCRNQAYNNYYQINSDRAREKNQRSSERRKKYYKSEKGIESSRRAHLKRTFNITLEEYETMSEIQNHVCYICGKTEMNNKNKVLCVDHCHETNKIRGLLCGLCNAGIGHFKDDINLLKQAIKYLQNYEQNE